MHEGHRSRFSAKVLDGSRLYEHELLEILLYNAYPYRDTNAYAHNLCDKFGGLSGVLTAPVDELTSVESVGENVARYIHILGECLKKSSTGGKYFSIIRCTAQFRRVAAFRAGARGGKLDVFIMDADARNRRICTFDINDAKLLEKVMVNIAASAAYGAYIALYKAEEAVPDCGADGLVPDDVDEKIFGIVYSACNSCGVHVFDYCILRGDEYYSYFLHDKVKP